MRPKTAASSGAERAGVRARASAFTHRPHGAQCHLVAHRPERDPDHEIVRVGSRRRLDRGIREVGRILERQRPEPPWWRSIASIVFRYPRSSSDTSGPKRWTRAARRDLPLVADLDGMDGHGWR
jgi:hypothetical protein